MVQELDNELQQIDVSLKACFLPFGSLSWDMDSPSTIKSEADVDDEEVTVVEGSTGLSPQLSLRL